MIVRIDSARLAALRAKEREALRLSFSQLLHGLVTEGWITQAEGEAWLVGRTLPAPLKALISQLPQSQRFLAKARALQPSEVSFADPLVLALGQMQGRTEDEMAEFFAVYSQA